MTPSANRAPRPATPNAGNGWLRRNRLTVIALLCVVAAGIAYSMFGRTLVRDMYEGNSWALLNRVIARQASYDLEHYQRKFENMVYGYGAMLVLATAFMTSLWSGRRMGTAAYLVLLGLLTLANIAFVLPLQNFGAYVLVDDFPKFFSTGVENAEALLAHGSPFGYNHDFQGGIPAFYLKGSFLALAPFLAVFGEQIGHQLMLTVFLLLIPVSLYCLLRATIGNETVAQVSAFMAAFQIRSIDFLGFGMVPAVLCVSLTFFALLCLFKYVFGAGNRLWLPAALLSVTGLLYTHLLYFMLVWFAFAAVLAVILARALSAGAARFPWQRVLYLCLLTVLAGLPFLVPLIDHLPFFHVEADFGSTSGVSGRVLGTLKNNLKIFTHPGSPNTMLLLSMAFLLVAHAQSGDERLKLLIRRMFLISGAILLSPLLQVLPLLSVLADRVIVFAPFAFVLNAALCLAMNLNRRAQAAATMLIFCLILCRYPINPGVPESVDTLAGLDPKLSELVSPDDHALFENTAHMRPTIRRKSKEFEPGPHGHWLTLLQRHLGARFFSHIGEDPHTYNKLRHMYLTSGSYLGKPLDDEIGARLLARLEEWGVTKVCVWSEPAIAFFAGSDRFSFLADSKKYCCFRASYDSPAAVRLSGGGAGRITACGPFSMTIALENISQPQTVTVARNMFKYWTATDEAGREVALKKDSRMISFEVERDGVIRLSYRKHTTLFIIAVLALLLSFVYVPRQSPKR